MAVFDLPMAFAKYDGPTIDKVLNNPESKFYKQLAAAYDKAGFHYMGMLQNGTFRLATANTNLKDLDAYKGLKIRTMSNKNHMAFGLLLVQNRHRLLSLNCILLCKAGRLMRKKTQPIRS